MSGQNGNGSKPVARNVLGGKLETCCTAPLTGFFRTGKCETGPQDAGVHTVCARMTREFLEFSRAQGNDLMTPNPAFGFPGLQPGDCWCVCAARWKEAYDAGVALSSSAVWLAWRRTQRALRRKGVRKDRRGTISVQVTEQTSEAVR